MSWKIAEGVFAWIEENIPKGSTILELGSGESSKLFLDMGYKVVSVEHDPEWLYKYEGVEYIYAPLANHKPVKGFEKNVWYDKNIIGSIDLGYSVIIVDGPPGCEGRGGFLKYVYLFDTSVPIIFDDLHRRDEYNLASRVSAKLKRPLTIHTWEGKHWGYIR